MRVGSTGEGTKLGDFPSANRRMVLLAGIAAGIGVVVAFLAAALLYLIGFFTNVFYYGRVSFALVSPAGNQLGDLAIVVPIVGGLVVGAILKGEADSSNYPST